MARLPQELKIAGENPAFLKILCSIRFLLVPVSEYACKGIGRVMQHAYLSILLSS